MANLHLITDLFNVFHKANRIKQDEERRKKSVGFAVSAIIFSLIAVALAAGGGFLWSLIDSGNKDALLLIIFTVAGLAVCVLGALVMLIGALLRVIAQLTINKKAIGWIAFVVFIAAVAGSVIMFIIF